MGHPKKLLKTFDLARTFFFWEYFGYNVFHGIPRKLFANSKSLGSYFFHHMGSKTKNKKITNHHRNPASELAWQRPINQLKPVQQPSLIINSLSRKKICKKRKKKNDMHQVQTDWQLLHSSLTLSIIMSTLHYIKCPDTIQVSRHYIHKCLDTT